MSAFCYIPRPFCCPAGFTPVSTDSMICDTFRFVSMVIPVNSEANTAQKVFNLENCIRFQTKPLRHFLCVSACTRRDLCFQDNNKLHGECLFNCECNSLSRACVFVCFASIRKCKSKNGRKRNERKALLGKTEKKRYGTQKISLCVRFVASEGNNERWQKVTGHLLCLFSRIVFLPFIFLFSHPLISPCPWPLSLLIWLFAVFDSSRCLSICFSLR